MAELRRSSFLELLDKAVGLSEQEYMILGAAGVRNHAGLYTLLQTFPSLVDDDLDFPKLSTFAVQGMPETVRMALVPQFAGAPSQFGRPTARSQGPSRPRLIGGAKPSRPAKAAPSSVLPLVARASRTPVGTKSVSVLPGSWPVRSQGERGTCVAFAGVACRELAALRGSASMPVLSEQFLFWAAKTAGGDPRPRADGTSLEYAAGALAALGVCEGKHWAYDGKVMRGNVTHASPPGVPSGAAVRDAATRRGAGVLLSLAPRAPGGAKAVLAHLVAGSAVAVALPMFQDARDSSGVTNWETEDAWRYGDIVDPPKGALSARYGHAVCIVGFEPDPDEEHGGYFIFRNSWGDDWAFDLPAPGYFAPQKGYGQISASYVEKYLWELLAL